MPDGVKLPMYKWPSYGQPKAILLALHGFNDYGKFIEEAASFLGDKGVQTYTYDQRGFGRTPYPGIWPGTKALCQDFVNVIRLLKDRHRGMPVYLLGHSMGGAILISALNRYNPPLTDGAIFVAPAVWGRESMPIYQRWLLKM